MRQFFMAMAIFCTTVFFYSCSAGKPAIPDPPASVKQVQDIVKGKHFKTSNTGFYGSLTVNDKTEMEWIDTTKEKEKIVKDVFAEVQTFSLHFKNDTAVTVKSKDNNFEGSYTVDDQPDEEEKPGIRLRVSYKDPSFSFGGEAMEVTYSYLVKGVAEQNLLLELPRTVNRRNLVSLMTAE